MLGGLPEASSILKWSPSFFCLPLSQMGKEAISHLEVYPKGLPDLHRVFQKLSKKKRRNVSISLEVAI
jgi:hypothetical protein